MLKFGWNCIAYFHHEMKLWEFRLYVTAFFCLHTKSIFNELKKVATSVQSALSVHEAIVLLFFAHLVCKNRSCSGKIIISMIEPSLFFVQHMHQSTSSMNVDKILFLLVSGWQLVQTYKMSFRRKQKSAAFFMLLLYTIDTIAVVVVVITIIHE